VATHTLIGGKSLRAQNKPQTNQRTKPPSESTNDTYILKRRDRDHTLVIRVEGAEQQLEALQAFIISHDCNNRGKRIQQHRYQQPQQQLQNNNHHKAKRPIHTEQTTPQALHCSMADSPQQSCTHSSFVSILVWFVLVG
jgi:hypothetical protein